MEWFEGAIIFVFGWIAHVVWDYFYNDDDDEQGAGEQQYNY